MQQRTHWFLLAAVTVVGAAALLTAGPITPPTGPVTPGGKTTQELFNAITSISNVAVAGRSVAVPGANNAGGTFSLNVSPAISGPLLGMRHGVSAGYAVQGGGYIVGNPGFDLMTIIREVGTSSDSTYKMATNHQTIPTAVVTMPSAGGTTVITLTTCYIIAMRQYSIQRADGTYAAIEELDLLANQMQVSEPTGSWNYNFLTHSGS